MSRTLWVAGFWIALLVCTWFALSSSPPEAVFAIGDKVLHTSAFLVLTFLLSIAHFGRRLWPPAAWMLLYGIAIELIQAALPTRSAEWADLGVDVVGIALGLLAVRVAGELAEGLVRGTLTALGLESKA